MGIEEKTRLLVRYLVYWINMSVEMGGTKKNCSTCVRFQQTQPKTRSSPMKSWVNHGHVEWLALMYLQLKKRQFCVVDNHRRFPIVKEAEKLLAKSLIT